jgi:cellulose synthase/poly-beta-1,6-N-acetylglucosamine synthase-like glycosyltransferase
VTAADRRERRVLFSAMKNEAPFVLEWIAYHKVIGFDKIIIVSNDCADNTDGLLAALSRSGEIHHVSQQVPDGKTPQGSAVELVNTSGIVQDGDWCIFLDADEFLNIAAGNGTVSDLIERIGRLCCANPLRSRVPLPLDRPILRVA